MLVVAALSFANSGGAASASPLGYVGCSNTEMAVAGYAEDGGSRFWPATNVYFGGTAMRWQSQAKYLQEFDRLAAQAAPSAVWFQVCVFPNEPLYGSALAARADVAAIRARFPQATIYVSALNGYSQGSCPAPSTARIRDWLVQQGLAQRGPDMPALSRAQLYRDGCHPNAAGQALLGRALLGFFG